MKSIFFTIGFLVFLSSNAFAGTATFFGEGRVFTEPEAVKLTLDVISECYDSAKLASNANDEIANRVLDILKPYADLTVAGDGVFASGGYVQRYSTYHPHTGEPICINKYKKINTITLKTSLIGKFADFFAEIQDTVYALGADGPSSGIYKASVYIQMQMPQPFVGYETQKKLEKEAVALAVVNAKEKAEVALKESGYTNYIVTGYKESGVSRPTWPKAGRADESTSGAPVKFDKMYIESNVSVDFSF